jgi:hypothetical protein
MPSTNLVESCSSFPTILFFGGFTSTKVAKTQNKNKNLPTPKNK